jgi:hypothetical protein
MPRRIVLAFCLIALFNVSAFSQETRSMLFGRVLDP